MHLNKTAFIILLLFSLYSCKEKKAEEKRESSPIASTTIPVELADSSFRHVDNLLTMDSYTVLSNHIPLSDIRRVIIEDDLIFILDRTPKIVCYNLDGEVVYQINQRGGGPEEYQNILDFVINKPLKQLIAYDSGKRRLAAYNLHTGKYLSATPTSKLAPMRIAMINGSYFFDNPDHYNYQDQKELHYSLLTSTTGNDISNWFFPHDEVSDYDMNFGAGHPFFYNENKLLYNKRFENAIYELSSGHPALLYNIELPDPLPLSLVENKIDSKDLVESRYSWGISNVFECDDVLYFLFTKDRFYQTVFYDLRSKRQIYAGNNVSNNPVKDLLFFFPISGVYKSSFFSVVDPSTIIEKRETAPSLFPNDLKAVTDMDNPVIAFYKIKNDR